MQNLFGRKVIYTSCKSLDVNSVVKVVNGAMTKTRRKQPTDCIFRKILYWQSTDFKKK